MPDLSQLFDDFNLRARVYPALLLLSPALANIVLLWPSSPLVRLAPLVVAIGVLFFVADLVRGAGQRLEATLTARWSGLPTQRALRLSDSDNSVLTERRRELVERRTGRPLPGKQLENRNPSRAAQEYDAAVRELIPQVRGKDKDDLLHGENIRYNFRRNALAVRNAALLVAGACALGDALAVALGYQRTNALIALAVSLLVLVAWAFSVTESWVKQAADTYCKRFFDAIGGL
jgi:hypothetical protein